MVDYIAQRKVWGNYGYEYRCQLYILMVYLISGNGKIHYNSQTFSEVYIELMKSLGRENSSSKSMPGFVKSINEFGFTKSENDGSFSPNVSEPSLLLKKEGAEFFFLMQNEILIFGKEQKLDRFLNEYVKGFIPNKFLN